MTHPRKMKLSTGSGIRCSNVAGLIKIARFLRSLPPTYEWTIADNIAFRALRRRFAGQLCI